MTHQLAKSRKGRTLLEITIEKSKKTFYDVFELENFSEMDKQTLRVMARKRNDLAREYHPDKYRGDDEAEKAFRASIMAQINIAYETLSSPALKAAYDEDLEHEYGATTRKRGVWHFVHWAKSKLKSFLKVVAKEATGALVGALTIGPMGALVGAVAGSAARNVAEKITEFYVDKGSEKAVEWGFQKMETPSRDQRRARAKQVLEDQRRKTDARGYPTHREGFQLEQMEETSSQFGFKAGQRVSWTSFNDDVPSGTAGIVERFTADRVSVTFPAGTWGFLPKELVLAESKFGFKTGQRVSWTSADDDVPSGTTGVVVRFTADCVGVKFPAGTWNFSHEQLVLAASKFGFKTGQRVSWTSSNDDVPRGATGVVVRFTDYRVSVKFAAGTWAFLPKELVKDR